MKYVPIVLGLLLIAIGLAAGWELIHVQRIVSVPVLLFVAALVLAGGICIDRADLLAGFDAVRRLRSGSPT